MHGTKVGWVGQTFALAKSNDSSGRNSRIRRSKEERKSMVESFIKKHQNSNNGNFPSLNLTHKEVGGSFYTVREIVREIIQENRVLGPAKLTAEEQYDGSFFEQYTSGSISVELQTSLVPPNEPHTGTHVLPHHHQDSNEEHILDSRGQYAKCQHWRLDHRKFVNCSIKAGQRNEDFVRLYEELPVGLDGEKDVEKVLEASKSKMSQIIADVAIETFPLRPVSERILNLDGNSANSSSASPICYSTNKESTACSAGNKQPMNASNGIPAENLNSSNKSSSHMHSSSKEPIANKNKSDIQHGGSSQNGNNPSLDRIILESWEVTSKKPAGPETNPFLAFFKAFAKAFVKFWSE